jgi:hypothetical protein
MTANETAAYEKGALAAVSGKMLPTGYTGSLARAFRLGKNEFIARTGTPTADTAAWLEIDREFFA